ncbi:MAG: sulfite exporter TauE/SafE family protein [Alphaproteobacteria bacterium]|nr:sulfite exporter TauE/SafE family protein [Alphaproteobacteria bacterium]
MSILLVDTVGIGLLGGFVSGFLGIGCGIIITPLLVDLGLSPFVAIPTQLCHSVGTNFANFLSYAHKRDVDFHLAFYILLGGVLGAICEGIFLKFVNDKQVIINKFLYIYIFVLVIFGFVMLKQSYQEWKKSKSKKIIYSVSMRHWMLYLPFHKIFSRSRTEMSIIIPISLGFITGLLVAALGGGNNIFMAPIITYLIGRISPVVYGTTAFSGFIITSMIVIIYANNNYYCDMSLVLLLFGGAALGSWLGVKLSYKLPRYSLNIIASIITFFMAGKQINKLLHPVSNNYIVEVNNDGSGHSIGYTILCITIIMLLSYIYKMVLDFIVKKITTSKKSIRNRMGKK